MEQLFLKILNMSITASYAILAVLLARLLLKKAPKKYSYALWSVVGFRLVCPVSFRSVLSLFSLGFFDMSRAQSPSGAVMEYIPEKIGFAAQPQISIGIPAANRVISSSLPAANPQGSINPMQIWIFIGMVIWCTGMIALLVYSIVTLIRLYIKMDGAVLLEGNVWQSDKVGSPFILGFFRPKIYIPFGLDDGARSCALAHERYHIKRRDHLVKPLAFMVLILHWFNPLVWLAFIIMSRDMEMSCDEKVLDMGTCVGTDYSKTLLSFASGGKFPTPSPLSFGETGVKQRIKNLLKWKKPTVRVTVAGLILCAAVLLLCAANPRPSGEAEDPESGTSSASVPEGTAYVSSACLYMNPLSSTLSYGDTGYRYIVGENSLTLDNRNGGIWVIDDFQCVWQKFPYTDEEWAGMRFPLTEKEYRISEMYSEMLYMPVSEKYCLLKMDGELWLVELRENPRNEKYIWSIHTLVPEGMSGSAQWEYKPYFSSVYPAFYFEFDMEYTKLTAHTSEGKLLDFDGDGHPYGTVLETDAKGFYWTPVSGDIKSSAIAGSAHIQVCQENRDKTPDGLSIYIQKEETSGIAAVYTARVVGDGFAGSQSDGRQGAVIRKAK